MHRKKTVKRRPARRHSSHVNLAPLRRFFSWLGSRKALPVWLGGIIVCAVYVFLFYSLVNPYGSRWRAIFSSTVALPEGYSILGIDVSHHQGIIDWDRLSAATIGHVPVSFVFIKATEGETLIDRQFNENFYQARRQGIVRGAYHFFSPGVSPLEQARFYLRQVHLEPGDLPPVLDFETTGSLSAIQIRKAALQWLREVEEKVGAPPIIYTNLKFKETYFSTPEFDRYPLWIAHYYVPKLRYEGQWRFWQHTDRGSVDGIKGYVDLNTYNGSMYDLLRLCIEEDEE